MTRLARGCLVLLLGLGCAEEQPLLLRPMGLRGVPVDTTVPGELGEGPYVAFGLPLPRDLKVEKEAPDAIEARGPLQIEDVASYFRDRVEGGKIETGPVRTNFHRVTVSAAPERTVDIHIVRVWQALRVTIVDRTRKRAPPEPNLSRKEQWGRMGLTPDGKVLEEYAQ